MDVMGVMDVMGSDAPKLLGRHYVGAEINPAYIDLIVKRLNPYGFGLQLALV